MIRSRRTKPRPGRLKGDDLDDLRVACYERDTLCDECDQYTIFNAPHEWSNSFHMAHIQGKRMHGDSLENVRTLCGDCHRKEHNFGKSMEKPVPKKVKDV